MAGRLPEEQSLLEKTLYLISSIVRREQIQVALTWIGLYRKRLQELYKEKAGKRNVPLDAIDIPSVVYEKLDNKIREYGQDDRYGDKEYNRQRQKKDRLDVNRISNNYRLRDKIESWERRKKVGMLNKKG